MFRLMNTSKLVGWRRKVRGVRIRRAILAFGEAVCLAVAVAPMDVALAWSAAISGLA
jgi:hypothetical protein